MAKHCTYCVAGSAKWTGQTWWSACDTAADPAESSGDVDDRSAARDMLEVWVNRAFKLDASQTLTVMQTLSASVPDGTQCNVFLRTANTNEHTKCRASDSKQLTITSVPAPQSNSMATSHWNILQIDSNQMPDCVRRADMSEPGPANSSVNTFRMETTAGAASRLVVATW